MAETKRGKHTEMGALISTVVWVAVTLLGVLVLVNTIASVRSGDADAVRNGLLLDIVYLLLLLLLKMYGPTVQWGESIEEVKTFFAQHLVFTTVCMWTVFLLEAFAFVDFFVAVHRTDPERLKRDVYLLLFTGLLSVLLLSTM